MNNKGALNGIGTNLLGSDPNATTNVISALSYRAFGAASSISYGNNRKATLSYDTALMRLTEIKVARPDNSDRIVENWYSYTENGLIQSINNYADSAYSGSYEYNFRNQMTKWSRNGIATTYNLDDWGNLTSVWEHPRNTTTTYKHLSKSNAVFRTDTFQDRKKFYGEVRKGFTGAQW